MALPKMVRNRGDLTAAREHRWPVSARVFRITRRQAGQAPATSKPIANITLRVSFLLSERTHYQHAGSEVDAPDMDYIRTQKLRSWTPTGCWRTWKAWHSHVTDHAGLLLALLPELPGCFSN